jgi:hypothetical protein
LCSSIGSTIGEGGGAAAARARAKQLVYAVFGALVKSAKSATPAVNDKGVEILGGGKVITTMVIDGQYTINIDCSPAVRSS